MLKYKLLKQENILTYLIKKKLLTYLMAATFTFLYDSGDTLFADH